MGESNTTNDARANIKQWFAAEIFQEGRRVVWTKCCDQLSESSKLAVVRVGIIVKPAGHKASERDCGGLTCHVDFGTLRGPGDDFDLSSTHTCTCELELFDPST